MFCVVLSYGLLCDGVVVGGVVLAAGIWADIENQTLLLGFDARWSLFHSCQCSVPSAEYSDSLEDDAMHCM